MKVSVINLSTFLSNKLSICVSTLRAVYWCLLASDVIMSKLSPYKKRPLLANGLKPEREKT